MPYIGTDVPHSADIRLHTQGASRREPDFAACPLNLPPVHALSESTSMTLVPQQPGHIPAGWYPNPQRPGQQQYWDGTAWTSAVAPLAPTGPMPMLPAPQQYGAPAAPAAYAPMPYNHQPYPAPVPYARPLKESGTGYLLAILLGGFGAHQFYLGNVGAGIGFIALWWGGWALSVFGIGFVAILAAFVWWIIDLCTMQSQVDTANRRLIAYPY